MLIPGPAFPSPMSLNVLDALFNPLDLSQQCPPFPPASHPLYLNSLLFRALLSAGPFTASDKGQPKKAPGSQNDLVSRVAYT